MRLRSCCESAAPLDHDGWIRGAQARPIAALHANTERGRNRLAGSPCATTAPLSLGTRSIRSLASRNLGVAKDLSWHTEECAPHVSKPAHDAQRWRASANLSP